MDYATLLPKVIEYIQGASRGKNWKQELADTLRLGQNATYKRINGTTPFTVDELLLLAQHYRIPLAKLLDGAPQPARQDIRFSIPHQNTIRCFGDYIRPILEDIRQLAALPDVRIYYAANEIPLFWYFHFEPLLLFKYFMWGRITWGLPHMQGRRISFMDISLSPDERRAYQEALRHYNSMDSTEFWSDYILDTTIHQIRFCINARLFAAKSDLDAVLDSLYELLQVLYARLSAGNKAGGGRLEVYHNDIAQTNTCVYVHSPHAEAVYTIFKNPNLMRTQSPVMLSETRQWFESITQHSTRLSSSSEKSRLAYLNQLERRLDTIKGMLSEVG